MRIVYYVVGWPPDRFQNGIVSATAALAPALRRAGHEAKILAHQGSPESPDSDVAYMRPAAEGISLTRSLANRLRPHRSLFEETPRQIARTLRTEPTFADADIIEMEESFGWSRIVAAESSAPVVTRLHGPWFINGAAQAGEAAFTHFDHERIRREGRAIASSAGITAPSRYVLDAVRNRYDLLLENAAVIPNAVAPVDEMRAWRLEAADADEILFIGRFDRHKGGDIVLRAFARLAHTRPRLKLTFAGPNAGVLSDGGREFSFAEFVGAHLPPDVAARVNALGPVPFSQLGDLRRRALATVIASRIEIFAGAVLEALAHGSPTVATAVGGSTEVIRDGADGVLVPADDAEALAGGIARLLDDPARAAALGAAGRRRVLSLCAPDRVCADSVDYYREVAARERTPRRKAGRG